MKKTNIFFSICYVLWFLRLSYFVMLKNLKIIFVILMILPYLGFQTNILAMDNKSDKDKKEEVVIESLKVIPRIKMTERNSLKSLSWWESKTAKIPNIYKQMLQKIKDDFILEHYEITYVTKALSKDKLSEFNDHYVLFGNLLLDKKTPDSVDLTDLSLYKIKDGVMSLVLISNVESQDLHSNFRTLALQLKDKSNQTPGVQSKFLDPQAVKKYFVIFESELSYDELKQIQKTVADGLKIDISNIKLLYSENNKYTFELRYNLDPFTALKKMTFVNGPYASEVLDKTINFKPVGMEESTGELKADGQVEEPVREPKSTDVEEESNELFN